jgi:hypothetical protein
MDAEGLGEFAGRVLAAFLAMVALAALVLACVVVAYFSAPSEKRHLPQGSAATAADLR